MSHQFNEEVTPFMGIYCSSSRVFKQNLARFLLSDFYFPIWSAHPIYTSYLKNLCDYKETSLNSI